MYLKTLLQKGCLKINKLILIYIIYKRDYGDCDNFILKCKFIQVTYMCNFQ